MGGPSWFWNKNKAMERPAWFITPVLRNFSGSPTLASKIQASRVECAYLRIWDPKELGLLPQLLASWPELLNLTLEIMPERFRVLGEHPQYVWTPNWTKHAMDDLLSVLTPAVCGAVHAPNLRHLGIIWCDEPRQSRADDFRWAASPWCKEDAQLACPIAEKKRYGIPWLSERILDIVAQRQQLSQGHEVAVPESEDEPGSFWREFDNSAPDDMVSDADTVSGPCEALQTIKLGGMYIQPELWKKLRQLAPVRVTCGPDRKATSKK